MPYVAIMLQRFAHRFASRRFPYPRRVIGTRGQNPLSVRAEDRTVNNAIMSKRFAHRFAGRRFPHLRRTIGTRSHDPLPIRAKGRALNNPIMIAAVGLPLFRSAFPTPAPCHQHLPLRPARRQG